MIPVEINVKGPHESAHDINDVHEPSHAFNIDIAHVIISSHNLKKGERKLFFRNIAISLVNAKKTICSETFPKRILSRYKAVKAYSFSKFIPQFKEKVYFKIF